MICCGIGEELAQKKWQKKFKLKGEIVPNNDSGGRTFFKDKYGTCLVHFSERVPGGGVVCHEAIHVAAHVLRRAGVDIGEEAAEEALAYYVSWVVREIGRIVWWKRQ